MVVQEIDKYQYQDRPLAQDSFGVLYEGTDVDTGEPVYIKALHPHSNKDKKGNDTAAIQGIVGSRLAAVRGEVVTEQQRYVVLAKSKGDLLGDCLTSLRGGGIWGRYHLLRTMVNVCQAVEALHHVNLAHGGINPTAIVVDQEAEVQAQLLCFEPFHSHPTSFYLKDNDQLMYLAQEQLRGDGTLASDIYALGMLLYVGFSAVSPYPNTSLHTLAEYIVWGDMIPFKPYLDDLDASIRQTLAQEIEAVGAIAARALQRNPGARYETIGEMRKALEQIAQRLSPLSLGRMLYQDRQFALAANVLEEAKAKPAAAWEANILLGRIYGFEFNDYANGVKAFKSALKEKPFLENARLGLADLYTQHGRYNLAKREYTEILMRRPDDLHLMLGYATTLSKSGNPEGALNILHKAEAINPYFLPAYIMAIQVSLGQQKLQDAEIDCNNALKHIVQVIDKGGLEPSQVADIYFLRGKLHQARARNDQALRWFRKALEQMPDHSPSHNSLAVVYAEEGQLEQAVHHLLASLDIDPNQAGIMKVLTRILLSQDEQEQDSKLN